MTFKPFPIVPFETGLERDKQAFLLENDAFPQLKNCHLYQKRIERRIGNEQLGRLVEWRTLTNAGVLNAGNITYSGTVTTLPISPGSFVADIVDPNTATTIHRFVDNGSGVLTSTAGGTGTIDYVLGVYVLNFPALPPLGGALLDNVVLTFEYIPTVLPFGNTFVGVLNTGAITYTNTLTNLPVSPGSVSIVIFDPNAPTATIYTFTDNGLGVLSAGVGTSGTIDYSNGIFVLNFPALPVKLGALLFNVIANYKKIISRPVMALPVEETTAINSEELKAFDTVKANLYSNALQRFVDISFDTTGAAISWTGDDSDFFWAWNYYTDATTGNKLFWVTNNVPADGIKYYNANAYPIPPGQGWVTPVLRTSSAVAGNVVNTCLMIVSYRNRLVLLNTTETVGGVSRNFAQRARWCQNGTPVPSAVAPIQTPWYDNVPGLGGYIDAPTAEEIVACGFYKDTLVVFFERSTWQLFYTGNEALPFAWQRINNQFGCESTHSVVGFDKGLFAVGNVAIITSDSVNVERIDLKIPTEVFDFHNQTKGPLRVYGIRDYFYQFVYWTFPNAAQNGTFPNKVLVLNYLDGAFSFYDDSYTCLGYYQSFRDLIWSRALFSWQEADPRTWSSGKNQADFPSIVGGNQQGFVMILDQKTSNDPSLYITNITQSAQAVITSPNHNLQKDQYVKFSGVLGMTGINDLVGKVQSFTLNAIVVDINTTGMAAYTGSGYMTVLNNYEVVTKKFNPFYTAGEKVRFSYGDFYVERTDSGAVTVDFLVDDSYSMPINTVTVSTAKEYGPSIPVSKIWQRSYADCMGQYLQMRIYLSDDQIRDPITKQEASPSKSDIVLHAINFWMAPSGRLQSYDTV
jgi:hypothetical protein